jgi:TPR repeat protein
MHIADCPDVVTAMPDPHDDIFAEAFGAFFSLWAPQERAESQPGTRHEADAKEMLMNTVQEYRRAAENGNRSAQEMLGLMYLYGSQLYGQGVERDVREATRWLELAATQESVLAKQLLRRYVQGSTDRGLHLSMVSINREGGAELGVAG